MSDTEIIFKFVRNPKYANGNIW